MSRIKVISASIISILSGGRYIFIIGSLICQLLSREVEDYADTLVGMDTLGKGVVRKSRVQHGCGDDGEKRDQELKTDFDTSLLLYLNSLQ